MAKFKILTGAKLQKWLKGHPGVAHRLAKAHARVLRLRVRVRHPRPKAGLAKRALALAEHYNGLKERPAGSNITLFGRWFGMNGVAWCAIFVSYILSHTGRPFRYSYVPTIVSDAESHKNGLRVIAPSAVNAAIAAGHPVLACYDWTHDGTADHVEFVKRIVGGNVEAIGGNTGPADWSNGGEVANEVRPISYVQRFVEVL